MKKEEIGHHFLARLGKTRLRPGGKTASDWLIANGDFRENTYVLDIACNTANTAIELAKQFGCQVMGIDFDEDILEKARQNIKENNLEQLVQVKRADITQLPFKDNSIDVIVSETALTMLNNETKAQVIRECFRILKPNGFLLTHDVMLSSDNAEKEITQLREVLNITVTPLTKKHWKTAFLSGGFRNVETFSGEMNLLSPKGLIDEEGILGAMKIIGNALKTENREAFKRLFKTFNSPENKLGFIAVCSQK